MSYVGRGTIGTVYTSVAPNSSGKFSPIGTDSGLTQYGVIVAQGLGAFTATNALNSGQLVIGSNASNPVVGTLTPGTGISIVNGAGSITINGVGGGLSWIVITANTVGAVNTGYIANKGTTATISLPTTSAVGDMLAVTGINTALGWEITQAGGQQIFFGTQSTTSGAGGSLTSSAIHDGVTMVCTVANLTWQVLYSIGNITVV